LKRQYDDFNKSPSFFSEGALRGAQFDLWFLSKCPNDMTSFTYDLVADKLGFQPNSSDIRINLDSDTQSTHELLNKFKENYSDEIIEILGEGKFSYNNEEFYLCWFKYISLDSEYFLSTMTFKKIDGQWYKWDVGGEALSVFSVFDDPFGETYLDHKKRIDEIINDSDAEYKNSTTFMNVIYPKLIKK